MARSSCDSSPALIYTLPTEIVKTLKGHTGGVTDVKFSHNGQYLASASTDQTAAIWEVPAAGWDLRIKHTLRGHQLLVDRVSWSPNDEWLLTGQHDGMLKTWKVQTGECTHIFGGSLLRSFALLGDNLDMGYVTSKKPGSYLVVGIDHDQVIEYKRWEGIEDFTSSPDRSKLVFICPQGGDAEISDGKVVILHTQTNDREIIREASRIVGASISEDSKNLILCLKNREIHLWDLNRITSRPPMIYRMPQRASNHACFGGVGDDKPASIQACFGGVGSAFMVGGGGDSEVMIWNTSNDGELPVAVLRGHSGIVSSVSWNPRRTEMLASATQNGDCCINIWGPPQGDEE